MLRKVPMLILVLSILLPVPVIFGPYSFTAGGFDLFSTCEVRTELDVEMSDMELTSGSLPELTPFHVDMVDAEIVPNNGEGVYIAVLDTGLHYYWPWIFSEANIAWELGKGFTHDVYWDPAIGYYFGPLRDDRGFLTEWASGHGTHVVSTIVGYQYWPSTAPEPAWVRGVAPEATIIPVLVLDAWPIIGESGGTWEMVAAGINYVADLSESLDGPVIISMSLGGGSPSSLIEDAIDYAIDKGVIVVASAGNAGYAGMGWPGAYPQVISCALAGWTEQWSYQGTVDWDFWLNDVDEDLKSKDDLGNNHQIFLDYLSSRPNKDLGQKSWHLDVATPGASIHGPYKPTGYPPEWLGYFWLWGTSMSAPHVSGIAAMVLQDYPWVDQDTMEFILKNAARGLPLACDGALAWDTPFWMYYFTWYGTDYGAGFLQADAALKSARRHA